MSLSSHSTQSVVAAAMPVLRCAERSGPAVMTRSVKRRATSSVPSLLWLSTTTSWTGCVCSTTERRQASMVRMLLRVGTTTVTESVTRRSWDPVTGRSPPGSRVVGRYR